MDDLMDIDMDIDILGNAPAKERETTIAPPITKPQRPTRRSPFRRNQPSTNPRPKAELDDLDIDLIGKSAYNILKEYYPNFN